MYLSLLIQYFEKCDLFILKNIFHRLNNIFTYILSFLMVNVQYNSNNNYNNNNNNNDYDESRQTKLANGN